MPLVLIKEDGTGKVDANTYADVAGGNAYHEGHLYATGWTGATADNKAAALVMATRLIDSQFQFGGFKANETQALQWPREECPDSDADGEALASDAVPKALADATCEMARELLIADRTVAPPGEGLKYYNDGAEQTGYDKSDTRPIISHVAQAMLAKLGAFLKSRSGVVRLVRS